jgi:cytochrome c peroxidase
MLRVALLACTSATASLAGVAAAMSPSGCTDISAVPPTYSGIEYGAAIQGLFDNFLSNGGMAGCADCHTAADGGAPSGDLDLTGGVSWGQLVNQLSSQDLNVFRVVPNHPEQSLLFQKINCDAPAVGARMPYGFPSDTLSPEQQALIYDWIAEGAPVGTTDGVFRNGFDIRGFAQ